MTQKQKDAEILSLRDMRLVYEGMTQEDGRFRDAIRALGIGFEDEQIFGDLERTQNRLNYAMLGIHPIYRREVELAGLVDFPNRQLSLIGETEVFEFGFDGLDPAYVSFLENQKRIYNVKDTLPLSSVALKTSNMLNEDSMEVPNISQLHLNVPTELETPSRAVLERAFTNSMVLMTHLDKELRRHGIAQAVGMNKDALLLYVGSNSFSNSFDHSVGELENVAVTAINRGKI